MNILNYYICIFIGVILRHTVRVTHFFCFCSSIFLFSILVEICLRGFLIPRYFSNYCIMYKLQVQTLGAYRCRFIYLHFFTSLYLNVLFYLCIKGNHIKLEFYSIELQHSDAVKNTICVILNDDKAFLASKSRYILRGSNSWFTFIPNALI